MIEPKKFDKMKKGFISAVKEDKVFEPRHGQIQVAHFGNRDPQDTVRLYNKQETQKARKNLGLNNKNTRGKKLLKTIEEQGKIDTIANNPRGKGVWGSTTVGEADELNHLVEKHGHEGVELKAGAYENTLNNLITIDKLNSDANSPRYSSEEKARFKSDLDYVYPNHNFNNGKALTPNTELSESLRNIEREPDVGETNRVSLPEPDRREQHKIQEERRERKRKPKLGVPKTLMGYVNDVQRDFENRK